METRPPRTRCESRPLAAVMGARKLRGMAVLNLPSVGGESDTPWQGVKVPTSMAVTCKLFLSPASEAHATAVRVSPAY